MPDLLLLLHVAVDGQRFRFGRLFGKAASQRFFFEAEDGRLQRSRGAGGRPVCELRVFDRSGVEHELGDGLCELAVAA